MRFLCIAYQELTCGRSRALRSFGQAARGPLKVGPGFRPDRRSSGDAESDKVGQAPCLPHPKSRHTGLTTEYAGLSCPDRKAERMPGRQTLRLRLEECAARFTCPAHKSASASWRPGPSQRYPEGRACCSPPRPPVRSLQPRKGPPRRNPTCRPHL